MLVNVSFVPIGTGVKIDKIPVKAVKLIADSKISYQVTATGIILEGNWDEIFTLIKSCQDEIKRYSDRVVTNISIDDYTGVENRLKFDVSALKSTLNPESK